MRKILMAVILGSILLAAPGATSGTEPASIAARDLRQAFADDYRAAEAQYLGKTVLVKGTVLSTGISKYMTPTVSLSDRTEGELHVICVLPRLDVNKLADFNPGQSVTMSGRVYSLSERGVVVVKECKTAE